MSVTTELKEKVTQKGNKAIRLSEHIVEIVSDSGEGAQKCGQSFASISAKMGNGVWTVEIIPAEIQPPARTREGASGIRIRIGSEKVTNMGNEANLVVAFNEQVPYGRIDQSAYTEGTIMLIESKWAEEASDSIRESYAEALKDFNERGYEVIEVPMEKECLKLVKNPRKGKNMWVLGMLCEIYSRDIGRAEAQIKQIFRKKSDTIINSNIDLLHAGYKWAKENLDFEYEITPMELDEQLVVMNGNEAVGMGVIASGMEVCSMYPITPATSASHYLADVFESAGGVVHQAEDEIAAVGFAIGSSYSGKTAVTITSGPGIALKTEFLGLAAMAEVPLVIVDVQRGGPSTGLPTKVEQSDLLAILYGQTGDAPKIVMAMATIEECFHFVILARKIADSFRTPVYLLTDANLATGQQPFARPKIQRDWFAPPVDQSPWKEGVTPFNWDPETGLSKRPIPGQSGGIYTLTGLAHDTKGKVSYNPDNNQKTSELRSKKLATFKRTLKPPTINGEESGDLLIVSWGSTLGSIEEAVGLAQKEGLKVSSIHLRFLSPLEPGLKEIFSRFKKVMTIEINYSDKADADGITEDNRRYAQLAWILRARTLVDVDCYSNVMGQPLSPKKVLREIKQRINK
ncbi:MAG: 2-oxoglutarate oxidoreductase [Crocinitomicaceae bacterium]|nr:2-oxoglutarate oxidoreductase [Crocinitomicaceae bacterium]|tara:strand:- start:259 stop:2145 length:1887 start_codon:yes stop_codon:yes gene_type:complete